MADQELASLPAAGTLDGTVLLYIVDQDGNSRKVTLADLKTFINTDPTVITSADPWRGAKAYRTSDLTSVTTAQTIVWQAASPNTDSIWSAGAPTRLTVPTGVTKVRLFWALEYEALATAGSVGAALRKNGAALVQPDAYGGHTTRAGTTGFNNNLVLGFSCLLAVTAGDYFELQTSISMTGQDVVQATNRTWFEMEIVEA